MTLNISEANAVNDIIKHLADRDTHGNPIRTREQVIDALALLARGAHKTLAAGYDQTRAHQALSDHWPDQDSIYRWAGRTSWHAGHTTIHLAGVLGHEAVLVLEDNDAQALAHFITEDHTAQQEGQQQ